MRCSTLALLAQVGAIAAMHEKEHGPPVIRFGPFTLDGRSGELRNGPTRLKVPDQSIAVLQALLERPGELVTREALRDRLWGPDTFVDFEAGLNAAVRRLREALNDSADAPRYIETLPRRGYRFIAPVDGTSAAAPPAPAALVGAEAPVSARSETARAGRVRLRHVVLATLALAVIGAALWAGLRWNDAAPAAARPVPITSFPGLELDPAISPDRRTWSRSRGRARAETTSTSTSSRSTAARPLPLTNDAAADHAPAWSPDGQRIAFVRVLERKTREIIVAAGARRSRAAAVRGRAGTGRLDVAVGASYGLSWTPDGKHLVFGDRSGSGPTSAIYLYSFEDGERRQLTHPPANLSDIHPVVSPDGRYLAFVRMNPEARGGNVFLQKLEQLQRVGGTDPTDVRPSVIAFDWTQDSRSIIHDAGHRGARIVANRRRRRRARARVAEHQGSEALGGALRCRRGLSEHAHRLEHLGTAHAVLPESPTLRGRDISRYRVDVSMTRHAVLTGWNTDRIRLCQVGPQRAVGVEPRRIPGDTS